MANQHLSLRIISYPPGGTHENPKDKRNKQSARKNDSPSSGTGSLTINGGTVELGGADAGAVTFAGTGTLKLDQPQNFTGTIADIVPGGTLDLGGVSAASASMSGNTLTVNETGGQSLTFNVTGIPAGAIVQIASDGHGGSDLTFTPRSTVVVAMDNTDVNVANPRRR